MNKKLILFIVYVFLIIPLFSVGDKITQVTKNPSISLDIVYPKFEFYPYGEDIILNFHVYNSTESLMDNTTVDCEFHLYNNLGEHIFTDHLNYHYADFYTRLNTSILTFQGQYAYIVWCNNTQSGFISSNFIINQGGKEKVNNFFPTILVYMILGAAYFFFGELHKKNIKMDSTKVSTWISILCYGMILIKIITLSYFTYSYYIGEDIIGLISFVWFTDLFVLLGISLFTLFFAMLGYMNPDIKDGKWQPKKW